MQEKIGKEQKTAENPDEEQFPGDQSVADKKESKKGTNIDQDGTSIVFLRVGHSKYMTEWEEMRTRSDTSRWEWEEKVRCVITIRIENIPWNVK